MEVYVCLCGDKTENEVREAIRNGATTIDDLKNEIDVSTGCGTCLGYVEKLLKEELEITYPSLKTG